MSEEGGALPQAAEPVVSSAAVEEKTESNGDVAEPDTKRLKTEPTGEPQSTVVDKPEGVAAAAAQGPGSPAKSTGSPSKTAPAEDKDKILSEAKAIAAQRAAEIMGHVPAAGDAEDRSDCRLYVGSLHYDLKENDIRNVFAPFGTIASIDMSFEPLTGKHKGYCFLEYAEPKGAAMALETMNGFTLAGRAIKVGRPTAVGSGSQGPGPKPFARRAAAMGQAMPGAFGMGMQGMNLYSPQFQAQAQMQAQIALMQQMQMSGMRPQVPGMAGVAGIGQTGVVGVQPQLGVGAGAGAAATAAKPQGATRLYLGSVPFDVTSITVQSLFACFGKVKSCQLLPDPNNPTRHRGYGFLEFEDPSSAGTALQTMNGFELLGRPLKVAWASNPGSSGGSAPAQGNDAVRLALEKLKTGGDASSLFGAAAMGGHPGMR